MIQSLIDAGTGFAPVCIPIFALLGIVGLIASFRMGATMQDMKNWKTTTGQLLGCRTVTTKHQARAGIVKVDVDETYHVEIRYRYVVAGQEYTGHRFKLGQSQIEVGTRKEGERLASKFKAAPELDVHYDPKNPELAVLVRTKVGEGADPSFSNFVGGIFMMIVAVAMLLIYRPYGF
jgi:hypothetical protein